MTIKSMTGFAKSDGVVSGFIWSWELKSFNARGLELRFRLPDTFDELESELRKEASIGLNRGNVSFKLSVKQANKGDAVTINQGLLDKLLGISQHLARQPGLSPPNVDGILALRGVIELDEGISIEESVVKLVGDQIREGFSNALADLVKMRCSEGRELQTILVALINQVIESVLRARASADASKPAIRARLKAAVDDLLAQGGTIGEDRLAQELALLYVRADVNEELDRLDVHANAILGMMKSTEPIGRQLDFVGQELSREANTLCAKAGATDLNSIGLELKVIVDRIREQAQNVE